MSQMREAEFYLHSSFLLTIIKVVSQLIPARYNYNRTGIFKFGVESEMDT